MNKNQIKVSSKSYASILPYSITIAYGKGMSIPAIVTSLYREGFEEVIPLLGQQDLASCDAAVFNNPSDTEIFLFVSDTLTVDVLLHECIHISSRVFEIIGSPIDNSSEELYAYITQFIFKECYNIITDEFNVRIKPVTKDNKVIVDIVEEAPIEPEIIPKKKGKNK